MKIGPLDFDDHLGSHLEFSSFILKVQFENQFWLADYNARLPCCYSQEARTLAVDLMNIFCSRLILGHNMLQNLKPAGK